MTNTKTLTFIASRFTKETEETAHTPVKIVHIERDSPQQLTMYAKEENGITHYFAISQELLDHLKKIQ